MGNSQKIKNSEGGNSQKIEISGVEKIPQKFFKLNIAKYKCVYEEVKKKVIRLFENWKKKSNYM